MRAWCFFLAILFACAAHAAGRFVIADVSVNGAPQRPITISIAQDGGVLVRRDDAAAWNLDVSKAPGIIVNNGEYINLNQLRGVRARVEGERLSIDAEAESFQGTRVDLLHAPAPSVDMGNGAYLNYDLTAFMARGQKPVSGGAFEAVYYHGLASFGSTGLYSTAPGQAFTRYETNLRRDFPDGARSLVLGDAVSRSGAIARGFRFGGLSYGTNYATRPDLITFALPTIPGESSVPTTAELLVNGQNRSQVNLPAGPFEIANVPAISGAGDIQLLVRDALGRQQTVAVPFYVTPALLRPGLVDAGVEIGRVRENFGAASNEYGRAFARGTYRRGLSADFTADAWAEASSSQYTGGAGAASLIGNFAVASAAVAVSGGEHSGASATASLERVARGLSFSLRAQYATRDFRELGETAALRYRVNAGGGLTMGDLGNVSAVYAAEARHDTPSMRTAAFTYSRQLGRRIAMLVNWSTTRTPEGSKRFAGLVMAMPLDTLASASFSTSTSDGRGEGILEYRQNLPADEGWATRARIARDDATRVDVGASWQNKFGLVNADAGRAGSQGSARLGLSGSVLAAGGVVRAVRQLGESFAVVAVPGHAGIDVYMENQRVGATDAQGVLVLPRLRAYEPNAIALDTLQLALSTELKSPRRSVTPARRAGVTIRFATEDTRGALMRIVAQDGRPLPAGATVAAGGAEFIVAASGDAWINLPGLENGMDADARWEGGQCSLRIPPVAAGRVVARVGPVTCDARRS